ncbi:rod shape-determining protein MreC [Capnocytophaga catalasegens]|uniref:rod shape-determining protein MreC n=1 Tax=Capnocytophaga catalasegens TaxID=1004260 RepID=UPI002230536D|nr:rod shape-determining protein MreC [Capnocytophaga catalasegens]
MRQIIIFFRRQKDFFIFLFLFGISFALIFKANSYQNSRYLHSANFISGHFYSFSDAIEQYFSLKNQNQILVEENKQLHQQILDFQKLKIDSIDTKTEVSFSPNKYKVLRAEVIKNSINLSKNYLLINKGVNDSVMQDMGVISPKGIVGIIDKTSKRFASVQSVLNTRSRLSVALKNTAHYGTLRWEDKQLNIVQMTDIPNVAPVKVGDTIVTDGRSSIFPKGIPVGSVKDFKINPLDNSLILNIQLFTDMARIQHVYIIQNKDQAEIRELEEQTQENE